MKTKIKDALLIAETLFIIFFVGYQWVWKLAEQRAMVRGAQLQKQIIVNSLIAELNRNGRIIIPNSQAPQGQMILVVKEKENVNLRKKGK